MPPITTGLPRRLGLSSRSTDTKNVSRSKQHRRGAARVMERSTKYTDHPFRFNKESAERHIASQDIESVYILGELASTRSFATLVGERRRERGHHGRHERQATFSNDLDRARRLPHASRARSSFRAGERFGRAYACARRPARGTRRAG